MKQPDTPVGYLKKSGYTEIKHLGGRDYLVTSKSGMKDYVFVDTGMHGGLTVEHNENPHASRGSASFKEKPSITQAKKTREGFKWFSALSLVGIIGGILYSASDGHSNSTAEHYTPTTEPYSETSTEADQEANKRSICEILEITDCEK